MKIGTKIFYFPAFESGIPARILLADVIVRPKSFPTLDIVRAVDESGSFSFNFGVPRGGSLEECIEVGNRWISEEDATTFGIDLEDGDQVLEEIATP